MAADVFYNFTGETAFASTKVYVDDGSDDYRDYNIDGKIQSLEYMHDNLSGKVFRYRNATVTVSPDYDQLSRLEYYDDDDGSGWVSRNITKDYYKYYLSLSIQKSNHGVGTGKIYVLNNTVDAKRVEPSIPISEIGEYIYTIDLYCRGGSSYIYGYDGNSLISSGTFYVDQETGIKVISGNPSWVAAGY